MKTLASALIIVLIATSCTQKKTKDIPSSIISSLQNVEGEFVSLVEDETEFVTYSKYTEIRNIIEPHAQERKVIYELIKNIDNKEASKSTYNSEEVSVGKLCLQSLRYFVTYEDFDESGDIVSWYGHAELFDDSTDLNKVKELWLEVYDMNAYKYL